MNWFSEVANRALHVFMNPPIRGWRRTLPTKTR
jgi:hypothetical protein